MGTNLFVVVRGQVRRSALEEPRANLGDRIAEDNPNSGPPGRDNLGHPGCPADARYIAFDSDATDLVQGDTNALRDVFFRDRGVLLPGDFDGDHDVDDADLDILRGVWGPYTPCPSYIAVDLDPNCDIDAADLAILLLNWTG